MRKKSYLFVTLFTLMAAALSFGLTSCSSNDDDDGGFNSSDLIGTWRSAKSKVGFKTFNTDGTIDLWDTYSNWKLSNGKLCLTRSNNGLIEEWLIEYKDNLLYLTVPDGAATEYHTWEKISLENMLIPTRDFFVGKWDSSPIIWEFYRDGSCKVETTNTTQYGNWDFNQEKRTLEATTVYYTIIKVGKTESKTSHTNHSEWKIIYATDNEWAGNNFLYKRIK